MKPALDDVGMDEEVRSRLKTFDDVLALINDMIRNIDHLMEAVDYYDGKITDDNKADQENAEQKKP